MRWYPFEIEAYRLDTRHLTTLEHGAYRLLLDEYYLTRMPLPDDDRALAKIVGLSPEEWDAIADTLRAFFVPNGGELRHQRCDQELDAQDRRSKWRTDRAKKAARKRYSNSNGLAATSMLQASSEHATSMLGAATVDSRQKTVPTTDSDTLPSSSEPPHCKTPFLNGVSQLDNLKASDLSSIPRMRELHAALVEVDAWPPGEAGELKLLSVAQHALRIGENPPAMFRKNVESERDYATDEDEDSARQLLLKHRRSVEGDWSDAALSETGGDGS